MSYQVANLVIDLDALQSINWSGAGAILSNGIICQVDAAGAIKIRGGANPTHVVIDRIGYLV